MTKVVLKLIALILERIKGLMESRPRELPPWPLAERYVNLSIHTAPIRQTNPPYHYASAQTNEGSS